jgi:putative hydrolase of the HAD superfamily
MRPMREALWWNVQSLKAIVLDIDGTMYHQGMLRRAMVVHLLRSHVSNPVRGWRTARILQAYRSAQELLRTTAVVRAIAAAQLRLTGERTHVDREAVAACVAQWIEQEPLAKLRRCIRPGLVEFLRTGKARGLRLGALSDYPAGPKLEALGVSGLFDVALSAQDPEIDAFKPNPRGLFVALARLGAAPSESLYVGDRSDVDRETAEAAGVRCAIVGSRSQPSQGPTSAIYVTGYAELMARLGMSVGPGRSNNLSHSTGKPST